MMHYIYTSHSRINDLKLIIKDLIESYDCQGTNGFFSLSVNQLHNIDKKILFSNIVDACEYEWYCESDIRLEEGIKEKIEYMQGLINYVCEEYSIEYFDNQGIFPKRDESTGFWYWPMIA